MVPARTGFDLLMPCTPWTCRHLFCNRLGKSAHPVCPVSTAPHHHKEAMGPKSCQKAQECPLKYWFPRWL